MAGPILVERRNREQVRDVDLRHELARRGDERFQLRDRVHVDRRLAVGIDRRGHAANQEALQVRVLAAQHRVHLDELALPVEGLEVMRQREQVRFRRQAVGRMAPVGVGKRPELAALYERLDAIANTGEVLRAGQLPVGDRFGERRRLRRIRRQGGDDVDPVERMQVIEVHDVVLHGLRGHDQVAQQDRVRRRCGANRVLDRADRGDRVNGRADAADALRKCPRVARIAALQDDLDAAEHRRRRPRVFHDAAVDLRLDAEMALDARNGIDDHSAHDGLSV